LFPRTGKLRKSVLDLDRLAHKRGDAEVIMSKIDRGISKEVRRKEVMEMVYIKNR